MNDWWLKFQRAEKHMVDINQEAIRYASSNPYSFTRIRLSDSQKEIRGRFHITEQPDPMIAVMLGDFIHNLRSALDYVVVACVPKQRRGKASFPILFQDIFAKDRNGEFVVNDAQLRENFETATEGLHPKAKAFIISLQPYRFGNLSHLISLGIISRLENADKHRQLITIGCGGKDCALSFTVRGFTEPIKYHRILDADAQFLNDDTVIPFILPPDFNRIHHPDGSLIQPSDMEMHLSTTAKILVKVTRIGGNQPPDNYLLDSFMDSALYEVREILKKLEFFVVSK
ncbi:MAG: hypothetical protein HY676_01810 [Chloroflexi bacterium]|nr:hypothetical protein [Chloroflexota bacterium]